MSLKLEGSYLNREKIRLFYRYWSKPNAKKILIITHGQAEHGACYHRLVEALKDFPINILAWDLRGHGRSEGQRGYTSSFGKYVSDLKEVIEFVQQESGLRDEEILLLGHSMGGLIQLNFLADNFQRKMAANILSSPLLGFKIEVPIYKDIAALAASVIFPQVTLFNEIKFEQLSRDVEVIEEMEKDNLRHDRISPAAYLGSIESIEKLRTTIGSIMVPTFIQISADDPIVDSQAVMNFVRKFRSQSVVLKVYEGRKHEIFNDIHRREVFDDLLQFIKSIN